MFKKILVIKFRKLGDTVVMTAPLLEIRKAYPSAEIHVAVTNTWTEVFENHPGVNRIWPYRIHKRGPARAKAIAGLGLKLRKENFDCVVNLHASPSSSILALGTGARVRSIHFHGHKTRNRYSTVEIAGKGTVKPIIERDMDTIRALGIEVPEGTLPKIFLTDEEKKTAFQNVPAGPLLGLGIGSSRPTKVWPEQRYATMALRWCMDTGGSAIVVLGPGEQFLQRRFMGDMERQLRSLVPDQLKAQTIRDRIIPVMSPSLRKLAAVISQLKVFVGNDSGPRHMAVALQVPTVTLFGPEHPYEWHPYPKDIHPFHFIDNLACRRDALPGMPPWCGLTQCTFEGHKCLQMIHFDPVYEDVRKLAAR